MATWKIPEATQEVRPTGLSVSSPVPQTAPDYSPGVRALGQAAGAAAGAYQKAQEEADALRVNESLVKYQRGLNDKLLGRQLGPIDAAFEGKERVDGFLQVRGLDASKASGQLLDDLEADLQKVAGELHPRQREAFLARARQLQVGAEQRVTTHVVQEGEKAKVASLKARQAEALRSIYADPTSNDWNVSATQVEEALRVMASSPEEAESTVKDWQGQVAVQRISSLLSAGDVGSAQRVFDESRDVLGTATDDVKALLERQQKAAQKTALTAQATGEVQRWVRAARTPGGYTDASKVLAQLQDFPADDPRREAIEVEVRQQLHVESERRKADTQKQRELAWRADLDGRPMPAAAEVWLREFDPDFLRGLRNERETRWKRLKTEAEGTAADKAAARRKQAEDDEFLRLKFASLPPEEQRRTTPQEYARVLAAEFPDFSPSRNGYAATEKHRSETVQRLGKGDLAQEMAFVAEAERETVPLVVTKTKGGKEVVDPRMEGRDPRSTISGNAAKFYRSERAKLGRDPTPAEKDEWMGRFKLQPEASWGKKPLPAGASPDFMPGGYGANLPAKPQPTQPTSKTTPTANDFEAWLQKNPNHPKAAAVRAKLGKK